MLGPPDLEDASCYAPREGSYDLERFNDCPVGMTSALEITNEVGDGIKEIGTYCCPSAYEFATKFDKVVPTGEDWFSTFFCRANTVTPLSDQTVTLTISTSPLITTEAAWDYERDFIYAYPDGFNRYVYEASGTTSDCYGYGCSDTCSDHCGSGDSYGSRDRKLYR
ncbi:hypothetical protein KVR01_009027 [Diaporthe batatas]|uniref:uncharacterized protein n=1 Tax=Diaporthe batatas TaxID=748121 RepID=UPI001D03D422|nr:uncharacterized protein KVR01_009027 [Diaporthe batatas]KAG8160763.1 hypothetical protein KVR01_009027 [Diaporthe batatas]